MKRVLYFAYGSNMMMDRLKFRVEWLGKVIHAGTHKLMGWKLCFNAESNCGVNNYANIMQGKPTDFVEGVLYELSPKQLKHLDMYEPLYYKYYFDIDKDTIGMVYICTDKDNIGQIFTPEKYYLELCRDGAFENNLHYTYNLLRKLLRTIDFSHNWRQEPNTNY